MGPVAVGGPGGEVALGGPQRRLILAILLATRDDGCSTDALVEALWGDDPPATAMTVLHAGISRLRKLLEPDRPPRAPATVIRSTAQGYALDLTGHSLDADRFSDLVESGRVALQDGDAEAAKIRLSEAVGLWRGPAYGDLADHPVLVASAAELEEVRLTARELLADARLRLGEHGELVGELESRVRSHPYRERSWGHLVLALYRSGRQADALAAYQRCRARMVDELGIEPAPELQELNEAVLLQSPDLDWSPQPRSATTQRGRGRRPTAPPAQRTSFVGREVELAEVDDALRAHRLVTITGPAGVGKTRLAIEAVDRVADRFSHGAAFCDLVGVPEEALVPASVAEAVGVEELIPGTRDPLVPHLAGRDLLLVVDNADHAVDAVAELADSLLAGCPRVRLLVTSRESLRTAGEKLVPLGPLSTAGTGDPAFHLFQDRAALSAPGTPLEDGQVVALCRRLDGVPLAIELAASRLRSVPLDHLLNGLDDHLSTLTDAPPARGSHRTLREVIDWSVSLLDDTTQRLLRRLAVFAGGCTAAAAATVCEIDGDPVEALAALVERSLVQLDRSDGTTRYRLLATIRADGLARLDERGELTAVRDRHLQWCLSLVPPAGHGEDPAEVATLAAEIDNVVAALAWALDGPAVTGGARLAAAAAPYWIHAGRFREGRTWLARAAGATPPDTAEHRLLLVRWGWALAREGDFAAARRALEEAVRRAAAADDVRTGCDAELLLAAVEIEAGELTAGAARLEQPPAPTDETTDRIRRVRRAHALGTVALQEGRVEDAVGLLRAAAADARESRMWHTLVRALTSLAQSESGRHDWARADASLAEALDVVRRRRLLGLMPRILGVRALMAARRGDLAEATGPFEEALAAARSVGDHRVELITLINLGTLDLILGRGPEAVERCEAAVDLARQVGDDRDELRSRAILAEAVVVAYHDHARALDLATDTIARSRRTGLRTAVIVAVESAAMALLERAEPGDAELGAQCLGAAAAERETLEWPEDKGDATSAAASRARTLLGQAAADAAIARGRSLGLDQVADRLPAVTRSAGRVEEVERAGSASRERRSG